MKPLTPRIALFSWGGLAQGGGRQAKAGAEARGESGRIERAAVQIEGQHAKQAAVGAAGQQVTVGDEQVQISGRAGASDRPQAGRAQQSQPLTLVIAEGTRVGRSDRTNQVVDAFGQLQPSMRPSSAWRPPK